MISGLQARSSGDNPTRGTGLLVEEIILTTLALATTLVRVGIRLINRQAGWDDATISTAMVRRKKQIQCSRHEVACTSDEQLLQSPRLISDLPKY